MPAYIRSPLPLISARMSFVLEPTRTPVIALRMDFTDTFLIQNPETNDVNQELEPNRAAAPERTENIAKPPGEPGRPNSGGYCLETTLLANGWSKSTYDKIWAQVHDEAEERLDKTQSFRGQKQEHLAEICKILETRWNFLDEYEGCWPIRDMLKLHLKYTSESARTTKAKNVGKQVKQVIASAEK